VTPLHPAFVAAIRAAWQPIVMGQSSRRLPSLAGMVYWSTSDGRSYCPPRRDLRRLQRLAETLRYDGPLLEEVRCTRRAT
jgi:hypothetical protein